MNEIIRKIRAELPDDEWDGEEPLKDVVDRNDAALAKAIAEKCAQLAEAYEYMSPNFTTLAKEIRHLFGIIE